MGHRGAPASVLVALAALLCGCGGGPAPAPMVPPIADGRNALGVPPCRLLTGAQLRELGLAGPGAPTAAAEGPRCEWHGERGVVLAAVLFLDGGGLGTLVANIEPTTRRVRVAGYPALETFTGRGEFCQYDVGIADRQVVMLSMDAPTPDSCSTLQRAVPLVVANLPPAGPS